MKPVQIEILLGGNLPQRLSQAERQIERLRQGAKRTNKELDDTDKVAQKVTGTVKKLAAAFTVKELVSKIATVRGEFQQLEVAFNTMLGSAEKAKALMDQLTTTAATTPFGLDEVANGAKQLLAYGLEAEKVNETLIRLGDIAAGLSIPLGDLVYLYGTTMAQGRLYTQDLNQFTGRGIPMISELAKQFGVAESKVKELVEAGRVGFPEVQKVIESLTDEGGKFGGLMEAQSKTITGQISNIEDAISMMFNEIGQQSEGIINSTLSGVSYMIENYERFGRILLGVVATYGVYRTAIMAVVAMKGWATAAEALHYNWLLLVEKAQKLLNATMLANPYVLVATLLAGVAVALVSVKTEAERLKEAEEDYVAQKQKVIEAEEEHKRKLEELCSIAGDESLSTDTRREALNRLQQMYPAIFAKYKTEYDMLKDLKKIKEEIAEIEGRKSITRPENEIKSVDNRIKELEAKAKNVRYVTMSTSAGAYTQEVGGLTSAEEAELKNLRSKRGELSKQIRKNEVDAYFQNLTGISNESLAAQIKAREDLLAKMKISETNYGRISGNSKTEGVYSADDINHQLLKLRAEQNKRNQNTFTPAELVSTAKEKYQKALDAYNAFLKDSGEKMTQEAFDAKAKKLKEEMESAKKEYDKVKPGTDKDAQAQSKAREKAEREAQRRLEVQQKLGHELAELQRENDAAEIEAMDDGLEKKLLQIDNEYQQRKNAIDKQRTDWQNENIKAGLSGELTEEQKTALGDADDLNEQKRQRAIAEAYKEEFAKMQEYLRRYGTFQEQKLAIASEYAEKIKKAGSEAERLSLAGERDSLLAGVKAQELKSTMDWSVVFGEFGGMFNKIIEPVLANAKQYLETDEFKNSDQASQQALIEAIQQMERSVGGADNVSFKRLGTEINAWQKAMESLNDAQEEYKLCYKELEDAQKLLIEAQKSGVESEVQAAESALNTAQENEEAARKNVESLQVTADTAQRTVSNTATVLKTSMDGVVSGLQKLTSGSLSGVYSGLIELGNNAEKMGGTLGKAFGEVADKLENVPIIGWIASIIDIFKGGLSVVIGGILDAVFNAVSGILDDILSGDLFKTLGESILKGVGKIFDALTWGGFSSWFGSGDSDKNLEKDIEYLTASNKDLQKSIDNLAEKMDEGSVADAKGVYEHQKELLEQQQANTQEMMQRSAAAYSNGFLGIGGHHSTNYKINKGMSSSDWDRISKITGKNIRSAGAFFGLSSEDMAKVFNEATDLYSKIKSLADDGYKDAAQYMDDYIEYYKQLEELQDAYREKLTGMSFDTLRDEFKSALLDMESDAETFAENFDEIMMNALVESLMSEKYSQMLKDWYKEFADAMANDGKLTDAELASLRNRYQAIVDSALKERDAIADAIGYESENTTSQSGKAGAFTAMSQDQGTKLEGLFTSVQNHTANIDSTLESVADKMSIAEGHLARIADNTGQSAGHLKEIRATLETIKRDGLKTR